MVLAIREYRFKVARLRARQEEVVACGGQRQLRRASCFDGFVLGGDTADANDEHYQT